MKIFVIMPYETKFDIVHNKIKSSVDAVVSSQNIQCYRLDEKKVPGMITEELVSEIKNSLLCIADVTNGNSNVMWEVGYAMALNKDVILIAQDDQVLPFDINHWRVIKYDRAQLDNTLCNDLKNIIKNTLGKYDYKHRYSINTQNNRGFAVAVTGSMNVNEERCVRRIHSLIPPYLGKNITWYVGSFGAADEIVAEYLGEKKENVIIIGYHKYDISQKMSRLIDKYYFPFIDAQLEQLPKVNDVPSERDLFYESKADLLIFLWDGRSEGIKELIKWFSIHEKDHLVGFV